ncbi:MAG: hypothetical protein IE937_01070 [Gammaproteobacteria bacterium]|nr:hypothetical protein [Gammaproteobacteria bacterium]
MDHVDASIHLALKPLVKIEAGNLVLPEDGPKFVHVVVAHFEADHGFRQVVDQGVLRDIRGSVVGMAEKMVAQEVPKLGDYVCVLVSHWLTP